MAKKRGELPLPAAVKALGIKPDAYVLVGGRSFHLVRGRDLKESHKIHCWTYEGTKGWIRPPLER